MADPHSTPDLPAAKTERSLIMGYRPHGGDKSTPSVTLSGKWLRDVGFDTGQQVNVKVMVGCIVLMAYSQQEQNLLLQLKEIQSKLKGIEATMSSTN
ncbi:SymE family type I addiction module toxin [Kluyvera intermedia]|uniref:SymE family type I addiction module toxin n=1 Tax=Kluyvera intermedia TaxID=61648 RepID=UPI0034A460E7